MWNDESDYYAVLGVDSSATDEEIKSAYRQLALRYHPDTSEAQHMTEMFRDVHQAYEVLSDSEQRQAYDRRRETKYAAERLLELKITVTSSHERLPAMQEPQMWYVTVDIAGARDDAGARLPLNLCLALDHSTSMKGERLRRVKEATWNIIDHLGPKDILSIVAFSDRAQVLVPGRGERDAMYNKSIVGSMQASGGTEIFQGLLAGMRQVSQWQSPHYANHVILLTDGQTYGDEQQCLQLAEEAGRRNIGITTLGLGSDWNDRLLDAIAQSSGGSSSYLQDPADIDRIFREKVRQIADTLAQQIQMTVRVAQDVSLQDAFRLSPDLDHPTPQDGSFSLGSLSRRDSLSVLLAFLVPTKIPGRHRAAQLEITALLPSGERESLQQELLVDFVDEPPGLQVVSPRIISALGKASVFGMQERAMKDIESGRLERATRPLETIATRLMDLGEAELAHAARLEAGRLNLTGALSLEGQKRIKYGTRNLSAEPPRERKDGR
jgi:Ca-activated chloride channel family protein